MFESIYSTAQVTANQYFIMAGAALLSGLLFAWIMSFRVRSSKRFFTVNAILPFAIATVITFVSGNIGAGVAFGGAFALIRFRSAQGSADEIASILMAMCAGVAFGMGYIAYGVIILLSMAALFFLLSLLPIFEHKGAAREKLLKVTIPESLEYSDVFGDIFARYLSSVENVGVKTTGMGSMFRLSYRIRMKDASEEKAFIDALRTKNGNLEISVLPYAEPQGEL
jgi:hypothetical protein